MPKNKIDGPKTIAFFASLADIQSAISFRGSGDGGRTTLDVPRSDVGALLLLHQFGAGKLLKVTVEFISADDKPEGLDDTADPIDALMSLDLDLSDFTG